MIQINNTRFDTAQINQNIGRYRYLFGDDHHLPENILSLHEFQCKIPICTRDRYRTIFSQVLKKSGHSGVGFSFSSGSSGKPLLSGKKLQFNKNDSSLDLSNFRMIQKYACLKESDVVANLFTGGHFSFLHQGINKIAEGMKCNVLPVGNINDFPEKTELLYSLRDLKTNVLFGTPSSIVALAKRSAETHIYLKIEKIIFTGETFSNLKKHYVSKVWPESKTFGLYGQSEIGFLGISTPLCPFGRYHGVDETILFLENNENVGLLVTVFDQSSFVPITRYQVSDNVNIVVSCPCGDTSTAIEFIKRNDHIFKFSGNMVSTEYLIQHLSQFLKFLEWDVQFFLSTDEEIKDHLQIAIYCSDIHAVNADDITNTISSIPELAESIVKGVGKVSVRLLNIDDLRLSQQQKSKTLFDLR